MRSHAIMHCVGYAGMRELNFLPRPQMAISGVTSRHGVPRSVNIATSVLGSKCRMRRRRIVIGTGTHSANACPFT